MSRVLIVEDSPAIRLLLVRRLEMAGHQAVEAEDGQVALEIMASAPPGGKPDLILLDGMMPNMSGSDVLSSINKSDPGIHVLAVSALSGLSNAEEWSSADGHIEKPIDFDDLLARVEALTSGRPRL